MNWIIERKLKTRRRQMRFETLNAVCFVCSFGNKAMGRRAKKMKWQQTTDEENKTKSSVAYAIHECVHNCRSVWHATTDEKREMRDHEKAACPTYMDSWATHIIPFMHCAVCSVRTLDVVCWRFGTADNRTSSAITSKWLALFGPILFWMKKRRKIWIDYLPRRFVIYYFGQFDCNWTHSTRQSYLPPAHWICSRSEPKFTSNVIYSFIFLAIPFCIKWHRRMRTCVIAHLSVFETKKMHWISN